MVNSKEDRHLPTECQNTWRKATGIKWKTDQFIVITEDFNPHKINKDTECINIYRTLYPKTAVHLSSTHGIFIKKDDVLGHKTSLRKYKKLETLQSIFSDDNCNQIIRQHLGNLQTFGN